MVEAAAKTRAAAPNHADLRLADLPSAFAFVLNVLTYDFNRAAQSVPCLS